MREQITMYRDMYEFYKNTKSKRLFVAFAEYLFEGIEPTDLKGIEKTIFNSLKIRMKNQRKKANSGAIGGASSHGGGRPRNTSSELKEKTSKKQAEKQAKNKEDNNTNVLLLSNILSYDNIYSAYYGKRKGIDEGACKKQIDRILKQGTTLEELHKCMVLYNCECRLKQEWYYVMKLETWLNEFQPLTDEEIESGIREIAKIYKLKLNSDPKFQTSNIAKDTWNELIGTFGEEKIKGIWRSEGKSSITLNLS